MLSVEHAKHFGFFNNQRRSGIQRHRRFDPNRLTHQTGFTQEVTRSENRDDRLFACGRGYRKPDSAFLNVEKMGGGITLGKELLLLAEFHRS